MSYQQQPVMADTNYSGARTSSTNYGHQAQARQPRDSPHDHALANLVNTFANSGLNATGAANLQTASGVGATQFPMAAGQYFYTHDGQLVYAPGPYQPPVVPATLPDANFAPYASGVHYMPQPSFPGYMPGYPVLPYTPGRGPYYPDRQDPVIVSKEVPGLENRRGSYSTNESAPGTPFYGSMCSRDHSAHVAVVDRSPLYSTPSPQNLQHAHAAPIQAVKPLPFKAIGNNNSSDLDALLFQHPAIPRAVPAVFTPPQNMRTLEQSLANQMQNNRNVYIRGLHPDTDDETLAAYATRFGKVETSKAIIDTATGACKG